ncbi:MAG: hypothetical protein JETCAE03_35590 [Ignavibacteriaceae bacterium]|nr:MAG: hypothetical protein JETCAE03_35590 [Ignavibacteriaceae bacterium]
MGLNEIILDKIRRVNDKFAPDLIGQDELAVLTDAVLDYKIGKPVKRGHFSRYDAGVAAGADLDKIADIDINGTQYILGIVNTGANSEVDIYDITANSWAGYIGSLVAGAKFKIIPFANSYIFVFDTNDDPRQVDKTSGTVLNLELGVADVSNIRSYHDNGGALTQSTHYRYVMVGLTEDGQIGQVSKPFTHYADTTRFLTTDNDTVSTKIYWKNLPYIADSRVKSRMIFRTKGEDLIGLAYKAGFVFYLLTILDNDSTGTKYQTEFEDNVSDDELGSEIAIFTNMPTRAEHIAFSQERLFLGNFSQKNLNFISPPSSNAGYDGTHTGANNAAALADSNAAFIENELVGLVVHNVTDGSSGTITANTATAITATLAGGSENDWDTGDSYVVLPTGYLTPNYELSITDTAGGAEPGTLDDSTQYDYRIHYEDKYNRLSEYYIEVGTTTSAGTGSDNHKLKINGIGTISDIGTEEYPNAVIFRRTAGTGSHYLIARVNLRRSDYTNAGFQWSKAGIFTDLGAPNTAETWSDPTTDIKAYPSAIAFSEISSPSSFRDEDKRQIFFDDGEEVTGIFDDRDGLIIFKKSSINKLFLSGNPNNWRLIRLTEDYGCDQPDTIQKSGSSFYFIYRNKAYRYDIGADKPVDIGYFFQDTLNTMQSWYDSTINDKWYCIQAKTVTVSYTLVYDLKLDTWYKFKRTQSASEDFKTIYFTKYGSSEQLLSNADTYVSIYNELGDSPTATRADTEIGSTRQISPVVTSKTFKFPEGISLARLRKLKFDYSKVTSQDTSIIITDADTATTIVLTDNTGSGKKLYESGIGKDTDTLKITRAFNVSIQGAGMEVFDNLRIEYRPIKRGKLVGN